MNNLFDISHGNILKDLSDGDPRKDFFLSQKQDGRVGFINNIESLFDRLDEEENRRQEILSEKLARTGFQTTHLGKVYETLCKYNLKTKNST